MVLPVAALLVVLPVALLLPVACAKGVLPVALLLPVVLPVALLLPAALLWRPCASVTVTVCAAAPTLLPGTSRRVCMSASPLLTRLCLQNSSRWPPHA